MGKNNFESISLHLIEKVFRVLKNEDCSEKLFPLESDFSPGVTAGYSLENKGIVKKHSAAWKKNKNRLSFIN